VLIAEVQARVRLFIARAIFTAFLGGILYLGFVDALIALLPLQVQTFINVTILCQPFLWAGGIAWWQERETVRIYDGIAARLSQRQGATWRDAHAQPGSSWASMIRNAAVLAFLLAVFGDILFEQIARSWSASTIS